MKKFLGTVKKFSTFLNKEFRLFEYKFDEWVIKLKMKFGQRYQLKLERLSPRYHDPMTVVLDSSFQALVDMIEKDYMFNCIDWKSDKKHKVAYRKMMNLYYWYKYVYPKMDDNDPILKVDPPKRKRIDNGLTVSYVDDDDPKIIAAWVQACKDSWKYEEECWEKEQSMLRRLIGIRRWLWT